MVERSDDLARVPASGGSQSPTETADGRIRCDDSYIHRAASPLTHDASYAHSLHAGPTTETTVLIKATAHLKSKGKLRWTNGNG